MKGKCSCGAVIPLPDGARFLICPQCGKKLKLIERDPDTPPQDNVTACRQCGQVIPADSAACYACGAPLKGVAEKAESGGKLKFVVMALAGLALITFAVIGFMSSGGKEKERVDREPPEPFGYIHRTVSQIDRTKVDMALVSARSSISAFYTLEDRYPKDLAELAAAGMPVTPLPEGMEYSYDPATGEISIKRLSAPQAGD